jgi:4-carboxymuconolactone decarboxylase
MARITYVDPDEAPEDVRASLAALPDLNIMRTLAIAPTAFTPYLRFAATILARLSLPPTLRELAILQVARSAEAEYEWVQHLEIARELGVSEEQIAAIESGEIADPSLSPSEAAVLAFTEQVVAGPVVSDASFAELRRHLDERAVVELLLTVGNYLMLARVMTVLELELDPPSGMDVVRASTPRAPRADPDPG